VTPAELDALERLVEAGESRYKDYAAKPDGRASLFWTAWTRDHGHELLAALRTFMGTNRREGV
jgi:hypothetical protein